jgi:hypothetical protein
MAQVARGAGRITQLPLTAAEAEPIVTVKHTHDKLPANVVKKHWQLGDLDSLLVDLNSTAVCAPAGATLSTHFRLLGSRTMRAAGSPCANASAPPVDPATNVRIKAILCELFIFPFQDCELKALPRRQRSPSATRNQTARQTDEASAMHRTIGLWEAAQA